MFGGGASTCFSLLCIKLLFKAFSLWREQKSTGRQTRPDRSSETANPPVCTVRYHTLGNTFKAKLRAPTSSETLCSDSQSKTLQQKKPEENISTFYERHNGERMAPGFSQSVTLRMRAMLLSGLWFLLICGVRANPSASHGHPTLSVTVPYLFYTCPVGSNAKLTCYQRGTPMHSGDAVKHIWFYTPHSDQHCNSKMGPRHNHPHDPHSLPSGVHIGFNKDIFWLELQNLTLSDQGRYCCLALDFEVDHKKNHGTLLQKPHSHVILHVTPRRNDSNTCTVQDLRPPESPISAILVTAACIMALLSLPLILVLVYKQRQSAGSGRRAHELVRMDSEAQGHENPVFLGSSPEVKTRTVSQIMTRQASETDRHLLSDPGTPFSPTHGDVFFPSQEPIPESPDFMQV